MLKAAVEKSKVSEEPNEDDALPDCNNEMGGGLEDEGEEEEKIFEEIVEDRIVTEFLMNNVEQSKYIIIYPNVFKTFPLLGVSHTAEPASTILIPGRRFT